MSLVTKKIFNKELQSGLLAMGPFFLIISSYKMGMDIGLITFALILIFATGNYFLRHFVLSSLGIVFVLIFSVTVALIGRMFLQAFTYPIADAISLFIPLLLINSLILSFGEEILSKQDYKSTVIQAFGIGLTLLTLFIIFGFLKDRLEMFSIIESPAGSLLLLGLLFATINALKSNKVTD